jgi:hypothetical protein
MQELYVLSQDDISILRELIDRARRQGLNRPIPLLDAPRPDGAPDVYVALAPAGGIPARAGTVPGAASCEVHKTTAPDGAAPSVAAAGGLSLTVYNFGTAAVPAGTYAVVTRDKWGVWSVTGTGGGGTVDPATIPDANTTVRGLVNTTDQTFGGTKATTRVYPRGDPGASLTNTVTLWVGAAGTESTPYVKVSTVDAVAPVNSFYTQLFPNSLVFSNGGGVQGTNLCSVLTDAATGAFSPSARAGIYIFDSIGKICFILIGRNDSGYSWVPSFAVQRTASDPIQTGLYGTPNGFQFAGGLYIGGSLALVAGDIPDLSGVYAPLAHTHTLAQITDAGTAAALAADTDATLAAASAARVPTQSAVKSFVENLLSGFRWKDPARAATTGNVALTGTQTVDDVALVAGDRVLVKAQTAPAENGIYVVAAGAWARSSDADSEAELVSATVMVREGTANHDTQWTCTNDAITIGTTAVAFAQVTGGGGTYSADETTLHLSGTQFSILAHGVGNAQLRQSPGLSVLGKPTAGTGDVADITAALDGQVMRRSGTAVGFGAVDLAGPNSVANSLPYDKGGTGLNSVSFGALAYGTSATAWALLAGNTTAARRRLVQTGTGIASAAPVWVDDTVSPADLTGTRVGANMASNLSLTSAAWTTVQFDTETEDTLGEYNPATYTFTPSATGLYLINCICYVSSASARNLLAVWTGTTAVYFTMADAVALQIGGTSPVPLTAGVGYTFRVFPTAATATALGGSGNTYLRITRLR